MMPAVVAGLLGLITVLVALARDEPVQPPGAPEPDWDTLPTPDDVTRVSFPLALPGYAPAAVEAHLEAVRRAYEDLLAVAPPEVLEGARFRSALRAGRDHPPARDQALQQPVLATADPESDREALRTTAALARIEERSAPGA